MGHQTEKLKLLLIQWQLISIAQRILGPLYALSIVTFPCPASGNATNTGGREMTKSLPIQLSPGYWQHKAVLLRVLRYRGEHGKYFSVYWALGEHNRGAVTCHADRNFIVTPAVGSPVGSERRPQLKQASRGLSLPQADTPASQGQTEAKQAWALVPMFSSPLPRFLFMFYLPH